MPASLPDNRLRIDLEGEATGFVLALWGELDAGTAPQLERSLASVREPSPTLVLDLRGLSFVDSIGLNMLFRMREWAHAHAVELRVVRAPVHVQRLIALAALDGSLGPFYADVDAALRS
jgi:stage II sporulation protein AA (anti-sigma F factor antagonist)